MWKTQKPKIEDLKIDIGGGTMSGNFLISVSGIVRINSFIMPVHPKGGYYEGYWYRMDNEPDGWQPLPEAITKDT